MTPSPDLRDELRARARALFDAGVAAAEPRAAVVRALRAHPLPRPKGRLAVIALGKAACAMAEAALSVVGPAEALVVTNRENARSVASAEVLVAGHPVPDAAGERAAGRVLALAGELGRDDRLLVLVSGGGSAMLPAPVAGVSLADKSEVTRLLLASGADITEMNLVRQQLSRLKGGGLARAASPAGVTALILSDVVGDDLRVVASGPTAEPVGTRAEARDCLRRRGLWPELPPTARAHLEREAPESATSPAADNVLVGSNALSVAAMAAQAPSARVETPALTGDVAEAAARVLDTAMRGTGAWLFGGETTVHLHGDGLGGRNQELALRVALGAEDRGLAGPWVFLSGGTDGRDGPTDCAGAVVDDTTLARVRAAGVCPRAALARNDSYNALASAHDLVFTGATGTNVADLQVLMRG